MEENRTYAINIFGIRVKRCCASCGNKKIDDRGCRYCKQSNEVILNPKKCCNYWVMSQSLSRAGLVRKDAPELRDLTAKIRALREHDKEMKELKKQLNRERQRRLRLKFKSSRSLKVYEETKEFKEDPKDKFVKEFTRIS